MLESQLFLMLVGSIILIKQGIKKFRQQSFFCQAKKSRIILSIITALIIIMTIFNRSVNIEGVIGSLFIFGVLFIQMFEREIKTSKLTIYDVEDEEVIELINSTLTDLGLNYDHHVDKDGKIIYRVTNSQTNITVKEPILLAKTKEVQVSSEFEMANEFISRLISKIVSYNQSSHNNLRGIIEIVTGAAILMFALYMLIV